METFKDIIVEKEVIVPIEKIIERKIRKDKIVPRRVEVEKIVEVPFVT